jgi:putative DNA primase/helicase
VVAALTVIKAYIEAGRPQVLGPLGSFEKWSTDVRGALVWLGEPDPIGSMTIIRANDPRKNLEARFIELWYERYGETLKTISEVTKEIHTFYENRREPGEEHPLNDVFIEIGDAGLNSKKIGQFFNNIANRVINQKLFYQAGAKHNTAMWAVIVCVKLCKWRSWLGWFRRLGAGGFSCAP